MTSALQPPGRPPDRSRRGPGRAAAAEADTVVLGAVQQLVAQVHSPQLARLVRLDSSLDRELGLASLELVELLGRLEELFGVSLPSTILSEAGTATAIW